MGRLTTLIVPAHFCTFSDKGFLSFGTGGRSFVQDVSSAASICDAENQHWYIRTWLDTTVRVVDVDVGVT